MDDFKALRAAYRKRYPAMVLAAPKPNTCGGVAQRFGQDQYRCGACGVIWDIDDERPPCHK